MNEKSILKEARKALVGRTIKSVTYMSHETMEANMWCERGLVLVLDNGTRILPMMDSEGNGPGALDLMYGDQSDGMLLGPL